MNFPLTDWQFWTVTVAAAWGLWTVARQFVPTKDNACAGCATGAAAMAKRRAGEGNGKGGLVTLGDRG
jgi:hypothetical protein